MLNTMKAVRANLPSDGGSVVLILVSAAAASSRAHETDEVSLFKTWNYAKKRIEKSSFSPMRSRE